MITHLLNTNFNIENLAFFSADYILLKQISVSALVSFWALSTVFFTREREYNPRRLVGQYIRFLGIVGRIYFLTLAFSVVAKLGYT